jgi:hypothetical protein
MCNGEGNKHCGDKHCKPCAAKEAYCKTTGLHWGETVCKKELRIVRIKNFKCERHASLTRKWGYGEVSSEHHDYEHTSPKHMPSESHCKNGDCKPHHKKSHKKSHNKKH